MPETDKAAVIEEGPGMGVTMKPASSAARTSRLPGSEMAGVPASEMIATFSPSLETFQNDLGLATFAEAMQAHELRGDFPAIKEYAAIAGIFARNQIDFTQHIHRTEGDILQITNGS